MKSFFSRIVSKDELVIFIFLFVGFVLYFNSFWNQMFWDDYDFILNNQYIKDWRYLPKFFSENVIAGAGLLSDYWRPLLLLVFSLEWHLWKDWVVGYHVINTLFHIFDAFLLFFILFFLFQNRWLSFLTALIFLIHPLQTEAVTYVNSLGDSLSAFFIFLGLLFYLDFRRSEKPAIKSLSYFLSIIAYPLALMSKETAIILPALILIVDFVFLSKFSFKEKIEKIIKTICPFLVIAFLYIFLRATVLNFKNTFNLYGEENLFTQNFHFRLFSFFKILTLYFRLLFLPLDLHMERNVEMATSFFSLPVILGAFLFFILIILALTQFKKLPIVSFGILWFFIGLAPTSNLIIPINALLYEHWLYLPLIGIFLILIWLGQVLGNSLKIKNFLIFLFLIFSIFLSILTINRNQDWRDPITFYNQILKFNPKSYRVINNLGMAYAEIGDYQKAEESYKKAISLDPSNPVAYHNLGNLYEKINKKDLALENYKKALSLDEKFIFSYFPLVKLYFENKNYDQAKLILEKAAEIFPENKQIRLNLLMIEKTIKELKNY